MTDDELAAECRCSLELVRAWSPKHRAGIIRMLEVAEEVRNGKVPKGVFVRRPPAPQKSRRRRT